MLWWSTLWSSADHPWMDTLSPVGLFRVFYIVMVTEILTDIGRSRTSYHSFFSKSLLTGNLWFPTGSVTVCHIPISQWKSAEQRLRVFGLLMHLSYTYSSYSDTDRNINFLVWCGPAFKYVPCPKRNTAPCIYLVYILYIFPLGFSLLLSFFGGHGV